MEFKWIKEMFGVSKPIIAMCHLQALPGDPNFDVEKGMDWVIECAIKDLTNLQDGGVDGVMFSNEYSMPYLTKVRPVTTACMARVIGQIRERIKVPFGVNVLWDPYASIDLAAATGALFIREIMSGVYASDFGLWNTDPGSIARHKLEVHRKDLKLFFNIVPEAATYLGNRNIKDIARTTVFNNRPDAICVSGLTAGSETDINILSVVKETVTNVPVFSNTGCNIDNIEKQLKYADGAIVGTTFKIDGIFENPVDKIRVKEFMDKVNQIRK